MDFKEKVQRLQAELKAPKNLYNSFGKYKYRNAESILEAYKPYGEKYKLVLTVSDTIECIADRVYVKATATLIDCESDASISNTSYAREASEKKGMDESQITGTASSYARKYALNGLFLLDDTKDADTDEHHQEAQNSKDAELISAIKLLAIAKGVTEEAIVSRYKKNSLTELTSVQLENVKKALEKSSGGS